MSTPSRAYATGRRRWAGAGKRTSRIYIRVNAEELAELERRCALAGKRELGAYVRLAVLAQRPPSAVVPELNRAAWLALAKHLVRLQGLAETLEALATRPRGRMAGLVGLGQLEDLAAACLLGSDRSHG